ncbi:ATP-binding protein [Flavobacterium macacae]|uniref:ATP-binding protein n=1 Tax=Flavobacterium macacae TaxID=2488993 RepID=A0A3P3VY00_9FLAO|nr:ATP-binding protein [Flavobacterium macacae]RRJ87675.1 hypothetical protein EG849_15270 [Flavobacterium macacae]
MNTTEKLNLVSPETIEKIKNSNIKSELEELDFKEIYKISDTPSKVEFVKDIVAFANSKGGYIIFGVNNSFEWSGLDERSDSDVDEANIANILDSYCDGEIEVITNTVEIDADFFFVIYVFPSKQIIPFKKDGQYSKNKWKAGKSVNVSVFKNGDVYCRRGSRSIKADNLFYKLKSNNFNIIENVSQQPVMYSEFIGRKEYLSELYRKVENENNRIVQIDGIGGIGKTSFVHYFVTKLIENADFPNHFDFIIWTSSKRNRYTPSGIKELSEFISNYYELIQEIFKFITENQLINNEEQESVDINEVVINFLSENKVLLIVDNLETLNDAELISFLEHIPIKSKAILTTRETLGDFYMSRINLNGFQQEKEFPDFLQSQYNNFNGDGNFHDLYEKYLDDLYSYTKGMPLAGQLITHQLAQGTPIEIVIDNLKNGKAYEDILTFCFKGSIEKLSIVEKTLLFIFSLSEKEELLSIDDLIYISNFTNDEIGLQAIPKLTTISLCYKKKTEAGVIGYSVPYLAKIYSKQFLNLDNEESIIANYENFIQEKLKFNSNDTSSINLIYRSQAKNHNDKVLADNALRAFSVATYNYDLAISLIDSLILKNNKFPFLYLIKGKIEENGIFKDSLEKAKKEFLFAIKLDNDYLEALIELGYVEFKGRIGNKDKAKEFIQTSISYFERAYKIAPEDQRVNLGLAQGYSKQASAISYYHHKDTKKQVAEKANIYFEKAFYKSDNLTYTERHSNAIAAFGYASNFKNNIRNDESALKICNLGLEYEPENTILIELKRELEFKLNPTNYTAQVFREKGWIKQ